MAINLVSSIALMCRDRETPRLIFYLLLSSRHLSKMLFATVDRALLLGFSVGSRHPSVVNISHLLFADYTFAIFVVYSYVLKLSQV